MADWKYVLDISNEWYEVDAEQISITELALKIAEKLKKLEAPSDSGIEDIIEQFEDFADSKNNDDDEGFDYIMEDLYDWGDMILGCDRSWPRKRMCFVKTF